MYETHLDTKTNPLLALHLEMQTGAEANEALYLCLLAADGAFGYSE